MTGIVVGFDRTPHAERACVAAFERAARGDGGDAVYVVNVVTQIELDATGELTFEAKRSAVLERRYPEVWKTVQRLQEEAAGEHPEISLVEIDVQVRFAPVHLVESQRRTAAELLQVAADYGATCIVLGHEGRPASVAEMLLESGQVERAEGPSPPLVLVAKGERIDVPRSAHWSSKGG